MITSISWILIYIFLKSQKDSFNNAFINAVLAKEQMPIKQQIDFVFSKASIISLSHKKYVKKDHYPAFEELNSH